MPDPKYIPPRKGRCLIEKLIPDDLLSYIFRLGTEAQTNDEDWFVEEDDGDEDFEDIDSDEEKEEAQVEAEAKDGEETGEKALAKVYDATDMLEQNAIWSLPFQVRVSHVCRRWRQTAIGSPLLWSSVCFGHSIPLEQSKQWIARAKDCPLDITIDVPIYPQVDEQEDEANADPLLSSQDPKGQEMAKLQEALDTVIPIVKQWEEFDLSVTSWDQMHYALTRLASCPAKPGAPALKTLSLFCDEDTGYEQFLFPEFKHNKLLFGGNAPKLERLGLWSVHLDWTLLLPRPTRLRQLTHDTDTPGDASNLVEIELAFHAIDVRPSFKQFAAIVQHSPRLQALKLSCSGPQFPLELSSQDRISIPSLDTLVLGSQSEDFAIKLIRALYLPNLTNLCLDLADASFSDFVRCLAEPVKDPRETTSPVQDAQATVTELRISEPNSNILSNLTFLKLSGLMCEDVCCRLVYENAPCLKKLYLNMQFLPDPFLLLLLTKQPLSWEGVTGARVASIIIDAEREPMCLPQLESLAIGGADGDALVTLVAARKAARIPLKSLNISYTSNISQRDRDYIRHNVEDSQYVIFSDDELEDVESEDEESESENENEEDGVRNEVADTEDH